MHIEQNIFTSLLNFNKSQVQKIKEILLLNIDRLHQSKYKAHIANRCIVCLGSKQEKQTKHFFFKVKHVFYDFVLRSMHSICEAIYD